MVQARVCVGSARHGMLLMLMKSGTAPELHHHQGSDRLLPKCRVRNG